MVLSNGFGPIVRARPPYRAESRFHLAALSRRGLVTTGDGGRTFELRRAA